MYMYVCVCVCVCGCSIGFVTFKSVEAAEKALAAPEDRLILDGRYSMHTQTYTHNHLHTLTYTHTMYMSWLGIQVSLAIYVCLSGLWLLTFLFF